MTKKQDYGWVRRHARALWVVVFILQLLLVLVLGIGAQLAIPFFTTVPMVVALGLTWSVMVSASTARRFLPLAVAALALVATLTLGAVFSAGPGQPGWQKVLTYAAWGVGTVASLAVSAMMFSRRSNNNTPSTA